ncbi:transmembrane protein 26b [Denticeps clupeoides]|uniref:Transmembrane protein 26 n=1 Tax=Denticeps clupeoides TaxID=299321 RepID=A0AAY4A971_9TELE|nr:transmembrane protein 26-like [Denticeps clupeoides]
MVLLNFICAVVTRSLFILVSLIGVWTWVKNNKLYWFLTILYLPLVAEMIITLRSRRSRVYKWFSPTIFLFLVSIIPTVWILEVDHLQNKPPAEKCAKLDSAESIGKFIVGFRNGTNGTDFSQMHSLCARDWILALHQILLILLIVGKWLLPTGGEVTRDELAQILLVFVGTAADILEFNSETLYDIKGESPELLYATLAVWTWSMLQFPFHLSVVSSDPENFEENLLARHRPDICQIVEALFIQDGPFLVVRLSVMSHFKVVHQMLLFFTIKNLLVVSLNLYRLHIIISELKSNH